MVYVSGIVTPIDQINSVWKNSNVWGLLRLHALACCYIGESFKDIRPFVILSNKSEVI
jgi:hypothetical protein